MASVAVLLQDLDEKETTLNLVYSSYDTDDLNGLTTKQLQSIYEDLRHSTLAIPQIEASVDYTCACPPLCDREELLDVLKEMDRRFFLAKDLQWEFAMLDRQRTGAITISNASLLFEMVYGEFFSKFKFDRQMKSRIAPNSDVSFEEIEVELCNIPTHDWIGELYREEEREKEAMEFNRKEAERKRKESEERKQREEEMKKQLEEEDRKMKKRLEKRKLEEIEKKKKDEEEKILKEKQKLDNEKKKKVLDAENKAKAEKEAKQKVKKKKEEQERLQKEKEEEQHAKQQRLQAEQAEKDRLQKEEDEAKYQAKLAEQERLKAELETKRLEEEEQSSKERAEQEAVEQEVEEKNEEADKAPNVVDNKSALENWSMAKNLAIKQVKQDRMEAVHKAKTKLEEEEAALEEQHAESAEKAENQAEEELQKAELLMQQAASEDDRRKAEEMKLKAQEEALKNREKRLKLTLRAAVKLRNRPKIDVAVVEAKDAKIPALKPDIEHAEKVSDSIKCVEELEDAMVKRNLNDIESAVSKIKTKGYEKEHTLQLTEAERLTQKLKRLEKLKKEIMALDQRTISEIRSYKTPIPAIHEVMIATYIILGYKEKELKAWKYIQALLGRSGREGLKRMCTTLEASKINMNAAGIAEKRYLSKHNLATITDVSAGAATFFVWSTAMIDEARSWNEDSEFRKKIEDKRKQEEEEAKRLQESKLVKKKPADTTKKSLSNSIGSKDSKTSTPATRTNKSPGPATSRTRSPAAPSPAGTRKKILSTPASRNANKSAKERSRSPNTKRK